MIREIGILIILVATFNMGFYAGLDSDSVDYVHDKGPLPEYAATDCEVWVDEDDTGQFSNFEYQTDENTVELDVGEMTTVSGDGTLIATDPEFDHEYRIEIEFESDCGETGGE